MAAMSLGTMLLGLCCGVGFIAASAFLGVVVVFLFVTLVGTVSDAIDGAVSIRVRAVPALARARR
jgi:hypothetical protein